jgi:hypothetical protein
MSPKQNINDNKKQTLITDYFKKNNQELQIEKVYGYNFKTDSWHCLQCGLDMGPNNPRQLCGKSYCYNSDF